MALWLAARDRRVPLRAKLVAGIVAAYALSPIDLIPDFVPVLGYLDDLLIVPVGIWLAIRLIPPGILTELRELAQTMPRQGAWVGSVIVVAIWIAALALLWWMLDEPSIPPNLA